MNVPYCPPCDLSSLPTLGKALIAAFIGVLALAAVALVRKMDHDRRNP